MTVLLIFLAALLVLFILLAVALFLFSMARFVPIPQRIMTPPAHAETLWAAREALQRMPVGEKTITSRDGLTLKAQYIPAEEPQRLVLLCHGWKSAWNYDFAATAPWLHETGSSLLLIEQRAHGGSEGRFLTFGIREREDLLDWVSMIGRDPELSALPLFVWGNSMGAATVLMAADALPAGQVCGIIADSGYTSPWEQLADLWKRMTHLPARPLLDLVELLSRLFAGVSLRGGSTESALSRTVLPVLLFHGTGDAMVSCEMSRRNRDACAAEVELVETPKAGHCSSYRRNRAVYQQAVLKFFTMYTNR